MNLAIAIMQLFPTADFWTDIIIRDDGDGAYIAEWNLPEPQPIKAELMAAWQLYQDNDLDRIKAAALNRLNEWRGNQRSGLGLTSDKFQELVYTGKVLECQRWQRDPGSSFGLAGEAAARGISNEAMMQLVIGQWNAWQVASDQIEAIYVTARVEVIAAKTVEQISAVLETLK